MFGGTNIWGSTVLTDLRPNECDFDLDTPSNDVSPLSLSIFRSANDFVLTEPPLSAHPQTALLAHSEAATACASFGQLAMLRFQEARPTEVMLDFVTNVTELDDICTCLATMDASAIRMSVPDLFPISRAASPSLPGSYARPTGPAAVCCRCVVCAAERRWRGQSLFDNCVGMS